MSADETGHVTTTMRHRRGHPCPVCGGWDGQERGKGKRCTGYTSRDGKWAFCSREEHGGESSGGEPPLFRHLLRDDPPAKREPEGVYEYRDEHGALVYMVVRWPGKQFVQCRPDPTSNTTFRGANVVWNLRGVDRLLYRLPELLKASRDTVVYVVEGEKDVETLRARGHVATCNSGGAGKWKGSKADAFGLAFDGRDVVVIADADEPGRKHAKEVAVDVLERGAKSAAVRECKGVKDVSDLFASGGTLADLVVPGNVTGNGHSPSKPNSHNLASQSDNQLPIIRVSTDVAGNVDSAIEALTHDPDVYQRDHELVRVIGAPTTKSKRARVLEGTPILLPLAQATILERLTRVATFVKHDGRKDLEVTTYPPDRVVSAVHARRSYGDIRALVGVVEAPTLRRDGTVLQTPGYDAGSGYLYAPNADYLPVPSSPTRDDAVRALSNLAEVWCDFPFVSQAARMVPVALTLTILSRPAIDGPVPAFLFDAATPGTGKTMMADAACTLATGRDSPRGTFPTGQRGKDSIDTAELEKLMGAFAIQGVSVVGFDDIDGAFGGAPLDKYLTCSGTVDARVLGKTEMRRLPWRAVVVASGNNLSVVGATSRRCLIARLESDSERPQDRPPSTFRHHPLIPWIRRARARLVCDALTVLRAFTLAGSPQAVRPLGSFESWSTLVAAAIVWAGGADPLEAVVQNDQSSTANDLAELGTMLAGLERLQVTAGPLTARSIVQALYPRRERGEQPSPSDGYTELREAIEHFAAPGVGGDPSATRLAYRLRALRGRVSNGRRLVATETRQKTMAWGVASTKPPSAATTALAPVQAPGPQREPGED